MRVFIKNRIPFYFIFFIYTPASFAQDYSFSQFWENRIYYNPSFVGLNEGERTIDLSETLAQISG